MKTKNNQLIAVNKYRTHHNGELTASDEGEKVRLSGWVQTRRDHGGLIFIDLRDKWGITQLKFDPGHNAEVFKIAEGLRGEYVIGVEGTVLKRPEDMVNSNLATGKVEVEVESVTILSPSKTPPFEIDNSQDVNEELRLKYRFIDLRQPRLQKIMKIRDEFMSYIRGYMHDHGFTEVQTPILANSSPEGARDFLVPSRLYPGKFYALPQAPQQFKQLLMVGGLDRYFQIAPCFRDEDPRADRHAGDFYQLDLEMSFVEQEDVFAVIEPLMVELTKEFSSKKVTARPFPRIPWHEAMTKYGSDKPDLRYDLLIRNITGDVKNSGFKVFDESVAEGGVVHVLTVSKGAALSRKDIDELTYQAKVFGAKGLAYIKLKEGAVSPLDKFISTEMKQRIVEVAEAKENDLLLFGAGRWLTVCKSLGAVRSLCADKLGIKKESKAAWAWITDFPMYEYNDEEKKIDFSHNPFSMPQGGMDALSSKDPLEIMAYQYDLCLNGYEVVSGAIRNHRPDIMYKAFGIAGYTKEEVDGKFGAMIKAFEYGAPPHGGCAPGLDRILQVLLDAPNIRDMYAFPKDSKARDLMTGAPSEVSRKQLKDLHLEVNLDD